MIDPFLYGECDGRPFAAVSPLDAALIEEARPDIRRLDMVDELDLRALINEGMDRHEAMLAVRLRACQQLGLTEAVVPATFPLETADYLKRHGIAISVDRNEFASRRRVKTGAELAGIRRATAAAERGLRAAAQALRSAEAGDDVLRLQGKPLTCERLYAIVETAVGFPADIIVSHGPQTATGHGPGSGPIAPGEPVIVDLSPQDRASACFADIARTFCVGEPDPTITAWHALVLEALEAALAALRPGVTGRELWEMTCDRFEAAGLPTTRKPSGVVMDGFPTALGHGVGLEIHEDPSLGRAGQAIIAGDVLSIEPFLCKEGFGAVQVEEIVLVTDDGYELLSSLPRGLNP